MAVDAHAEVLSFTALDEQSVRCTDCGGFLLALLELEGDVTFRTSCYKCGHRNVFVYRAGRIKSVKNQPEPTPVEPT